MSAAEMPRPRTIRVSSLRLRGRSDLGHKLQNVGPLPLLRKGISILLKDVLRYKCHKKIGYTLITPKAAQTPAMIYRVGEG